MSRILTQIHVFARSPSTPEATLVAGHSSFPCLIGRTGITRTKREGDGASPVGEFRLLHGYWRADRLEKPATSLPMQPLQTSDAWCDAPDHDQYNRHVSLPFAASHEIMWREDEAYDVVIVLDYNIAPRRHNAGSAIFMHLIRQGATFTQGCIALAQADMLKLLPLVGPHTSIIIKL